MSQPDPGYNVIHYERGEIKSLFASHRGADQLAIGAKHHIEYFDEYFDHFKTQTVVVEQTYIDHDYLDDFAGYYVRCFNEYGRFATRLHFFKNAFSRDDFTALLRGGGPLTQAILQGGYLGFIVVKPLPSSIVGRTCLTTYDDDPRRQFPSTRRYEVNLFGLALNVETLAFQEQDRVTAACATSALWSVFQGTAMLFRHAIPSPVEITKAGTTHVPRTPLPAGRALPNQGLTAIQIAYAVRHVGLEAHVIGINDAYSLQSTAYAYLKARVPLLLVVQLEETIAGTVESSGLHAVAITGYSAGMASPSPWGPTGIPFTASRVDKLYAHDDQIGPFARLPFGPNGILATQWKSKKVVGGRLSARPIILLVPLYNKIRISNHRIETIAIWLDHLIEAIRTRTNLGFASRIEWDVHLTDVSEVKAAWFQNLTDETQRLRLLPKSLPKYLWRVIGIADGKQQLELLFDATDVDQGALLVAGVDRIGALSAALKALAPGDAVPDLAVRAVLQHADEFSV